MPRGSRIDAVGAVQHIMVRGIERTKIFKSDTDRDRFVQRLSDILSDTKTTCYAWSLMPNHFHLLLRTGETPISNVMRRLLTGYAIEFNWRHHRTGHLFQNRFKSVLCQEDAYLLELVRYIHLNPIRAGLVKNLDELDRYPYSGHSFLMGTLTNTWQEIDGHSNHVWEEEIFGTASLQIIRRKGDRTGKKTRIVGRRTDPERRGMGGLKGVEKREGGSEER